MAATQKAIAITEVGKPLTRIERPIPEPGSNEVQVKVKVVGINPHDEKARDMGLFVSGNLPGIMGADVVGVVTKLGDGVSGIAVGDRVAFQPDFAVNWNQQGLQEYALGSVGSIMKIPDFITDQEAATLPTNISASLVALFKDLEIPAPWLPPAADFDYANTTLLVIGGGSNCGKFGVQLAKLAGIGRIVVVGGNEAELKGYGATHVLDRHGGDDAVLARIRDVVGDELIHAYDPVNDAEKVVLGANALSSYKKGILARLIPFPPADKSKVIGKKAGFEIRDVYGLSASHPELAGTFWARCPEYLKSGAIKPLNYVVKNLQDFEPGPVNEVMDAYRDGKPVTKTHFVL